MSLRRLASQSLACFALALPLVACDDTGTSEEDITDVNQSKVKKQSIGNCWAYATVGWAESLHLTETGNELNLSESWVSYWHWYDQIVGGPGGGTPALASLDKGQISTGGWYGLAAEIMRRYGVIDEGAFIPEEQEEARSARQSSALNAINESLKNGALKDPAARRDRKLVRAELDKAWGLSADVIKRLDDTFGATVSKSFLNGAVPASGSGIQLAKDIPVGMDITLADAIGTPSSSWNFLQRKGKFAWNEVNYPTSASARRDLQIRMQAAMHDGMPVIMVWFVDFAAMDSQNRFMAPPETPGRQGGHMTIVEDYQINDVPGFGTLKAGELVTDPAALDAALSPQAKIEFIRMKNSWGTSLAPNSSGEEFRGYHDIYAAYFDAQLTRCTESNGDKCGIKSKTNGLTGLVLPPPTFVTSAKAKPGGCEVNLCATGAKLSADSCPNDAKQECIDSVCAADSFCCTNEWDEVCVDGAKKNANCSSSLSCG
jgi:hypothetical protein